MARRNNINCVILCGGKGTRMQSEEKHKVCFNINGKPAIHHGIDRYKKAGIERFIVVVGPLVGQVVKCIGSRYDGISFAYQKEALGTGNAARVGWNTIKKLGITGPLLVTMGDKIVDPSVIESLIQQYYQTESDLVFAVQPRTYNETGGHIVLDNDNRVRGISESLDIERAILYKKLLEESNYSLSEIAASKEMIQDKTQQIVTSKRKRKKVLEGINDILEKNNISSKATLNKIIQKSYIYFGKDKFDAESVKNTKYVNAAVYLFNPEAFTYALQYMTRDNVENEEYLTEIINILCNTRENGNYKYNVNILPVAEKEKILTYNNVDELLEVREIMKKEKKIKPDYH